MILNANKDPNFSYQFPQISHCKSLYLLSVKFFSFSLHDRSNNYQKMYCCYNTVDLKKTKTKTKNSHWTALDWVQTQRNLTSPATVARVWDTWGVSLFPSQGETATPCAFRDASRGLRKPVLLPCTYTANEKHFSAFWNVPWLLTALPPEASQNLNSISKVNSSAFSSAAYELRGECKPKQESRGVQHWLEFERLHTWNLMASCGSSSLWNHPVVVWWEGGS